MLKKWCMSKIQKMFRYLSHDIDIKYILSYIGMDELGRVQYIHILYLIPVVTISMFGYMS